MTSPAIETLVMKRANSSQIRPARVEEGMETLREDGWKKVCAGLTTIAEVLGNTELRRGDRLRFFYKAVDAAGTVQLRLPDGGRTGKPFFASLERKAYSP